jgi:hypothetical protein
MDARADAHHAVHRHDAVGNSLTVRHTVADGDAIRAPRPERFLTATASATAARRQRH